MSRIISIHSFRGGTGKSNTTANIATLLAAQGNRVAIIDTDIQSPGVHVPFGLQESDMRYTLNDYLWGRCEIAEAAYDVTSRIGQMAGKLFLVPASIKASEITRILQGGYDVGLFHDGYDDLIEALNLDVLIIDTHPGLNEETLLSIAISDATAIILRPDQQDYQGTSVTVEVARRLVEDLFMVLIVNKVPSVFDPMEVKAKVEKSYNCPVIAVLPHSDEMMALMSAGIFVLRYPSHPITEQYKHAAAALMS